MIVGVNSQVGLTIRGLWPNAKWTDPLREQWKDKLKKWNSNEICDALKNHHANSKATCPVLSDVLSLLRQNTRIDDHKSSANMPTLEELALMHEKMVKRIKGASKTELVKAKETARDICPVRSSDYSDDVSKWTKIQVNLIYQTLTPENS